MKDSVSRHQQVSQLYDNAKTAVAEQAEELENVKTKYEREVYEHSRDKRVLNDTKVEFELLSAEVKTLKSELTRRHTKYEHRLRDLRDERDRAKTTSMEEVQDIIRRDEKLQKLCDDVKLLCKQKERANRDLEKENARLSRMLQRDSRMPSTSSRDVQMSSSSTLTSRSKSIRMFQAANIEVEAQKRKREEEEKVARRKEEQKGMLRKSSSQAAKASRISQHLIKRRTPKPSYIGTTTTVPRSRSSSRPPTSSRQQTLDVRPALSSTRLRVQKKAKRDHGTIFKFGS
eukprot:CAMPEP_0197243704 /NCGR_PEP_ID=MMETSP1429-20130617/9073_1 /TAXON_ID=49237 /ORGANISM="Chaetoceros  sp., Strain UNC1202" /LENGTH=286 /DNA_ID=CAMNT_0042703967 /DNA_START=13 /DNA_END=873 /DNA_ORIENTATION=-